jgi:SAM-dependent methyltransferase
MAGKVVADWMCGRSMPDFPAAIECRFFDPVPGSPIKRRPPPPPEQPVTARPKFHFVEEYRKLVRELIAKHPLDEAMSIAVGGTFEFVGQLEKSILIAAGLEPRHTLVDVGCGSGRLAIALKDYLAPEGRLIGTDVVPELLDYARERTPSHWEYRLVEDVSIPCQDESADVVSLFSVLTHLLQHESYCYLLEVRRVLRPGGRLVFSFLELPYNWEIFQATYRVFRSGRPVAHLNEFIGRDAIACWAEHLGMRILEIVGANEQRIGMPGEKPGDPPRKMALGQSYCVMQKPATDGPASSARLP